MPTALKESTIPSQPSSSQAPSPDVILAHISLHFLPVLLWTFTYVWMYLYWTHTRFVCFGLLFLFVYVNEIFPSILSCSSCLPPRKVPTGNTATSAPRDLPHPRELLPRLPQLGCYPSIRDVWVVSAPMVLKLRQHFLPRVDAIFQPSFYLSLWKLLPNMALPAVSPSLSTQNRGRQVSCPECQGCYFWNIVIITPPVPTQCLRTKKGFFFLRLHSTRGYDVR